MDSKSTNESSLSVEKLLDPDNPFVLTVVLPAAVLAALGMRKAAMFWIFACVAWNVGKRFL